MKRRTLLLFCLVVALGAATGCRSRGPSPNLTGNARHVLVVAASIDALSLDPAVAYEFVSSNVVMNMYQTLIRYDGNDFTKPLPCLADRWKISRNGLRYTFHLRRGLRFASGAPLDAAAVKFSLDRCLTMKAGPSGILSENLAPDRIHVINARTVQMQLLHPSSYFLCTLFNPAAAIVDPSVVKLHPENWMSDHSAGSGPFVLQRWERDSDIVLVRNEHYWGPRPPLRRVIIKDVRESGLQQMMLERGDVDMALDLTPLQISEAQAACPRVRVVEGPFLRLFYLGMNVTKAPFRDVRVRQAIRAAIDYRGLVKYMARGHAIALQGPIIKGLLGYDPHLGVVKHNPKLARALLAAAGYPHGFDTTLYSSSGSTPFGPSREEVCEKLQSDLGKVGIRVHLKMLLGSAYLDLYRHRKTDLNMGDWGADYPDPFNFAQPFGRSDGALATRVGFSDPRLDRLIDLAGRELRPDLRRKLYIRIQRRLMKIGPWAILLQPTRELPIRAEVHGYRYNAMSPMDYGHVRKGQP